MGQAEKPNSTRHLNSLAGKCDSAPGTITPLSQHFKTSQAILYGIGISEKSWTLRSSPSQSAPLHAAPPHGFVGRDVGLALVSAGPRPTAGDIDGCRLAAKAAVGPRAFHASPLWTLQRLCFGADVAAAYADRVENRDPAKATTTSKKVIDNGNAMRERPGIQG